MLGRDLDIDVILTAVDVPVLDTAVGEVHVAVEARQVVFVANARSPARPDPAVRVTAALLSVPVSLLHGCLLRA